jgi:hypothetical protein
VGHSRPSTGLLYLLHLVIQISYIILAVTQQQVKKQFKHAVESWVLLARYFIYAAYLGKGKGLKVNCHTDTHGE